MPNPSPFLNPRYKQIWHGGDYSPEQWSREVWDEDFALMEEAKFSVPTLGVFSWVSLEAEECQFDFGWLDEIVARLEESNRWFILATPSAAPPAWMSQKYPEILRTGPDRVRRRHGNRVNYNLGSAVYREKSRRMAYELAKRYGSNPRLLAWHVSNEYGGDDFGPESIAQFRVWLEDRYGTLDRLNAAYWTSFWGHTFTEWDQIDAPGEPYAETAIQGLTVDWRRFVTAQTVEFMKNEAAPLRELSPDVPITTNFMGTYPGLDYRKFAPHLDFTCWDSYPGFAGSLTDSATWVDVAFKHDLTRCLTKDRKWMLMEFTPSSSNWYPAMSLKKPGIHRFEALQSVAHGADGVHYFQWRQSRGSQEQFHGAVVGHAAGSRSRVFQDVRQVGVELASLSDVAGSRVVSEVAIIYDWEVRWAIDAACGPVQRNKEYERTCREHYKVFWEAGISTDIIGLDDPLDGYKIVVAPMIYSLRPGFAEKVEVFVFAGGIFVTTYLSGWTDESSLVFEGGFLGPLKKVLGIWSEELDVLDKDVQNEVSVESWEGEGRYTAHEFCELIHAETARVLGTYGRDFYRGRPALTINDFGSGHAYYIASRNEYGFTKRLLTKLLHKVGIALPTNHLPPGVTVQMRKGPTTSWSFFLNANAESVQVETKDWGILDLEPWGCAIQMTGD